MVKAALDSCGKGASVMVKQSFTLLLMYVRSISKVTQITFNLQHF